MLWYVAATDKGWMTSKAHLRQSYKIQDKICIALMQLVSISVAEHTAKVICPMNYLTVTVRHLSLQASKCNLRITIPVSTFPFTSMHFQMAAAKRRFWTLTKSAMLATWMASCTISARVLPFRFSNIARSMTSAVSMYLVASRTSRFRRPAPLACCSSISSGRKPDICFWRRPPDPRRSNDGGLAQPLFDLVRASNITCGCFCKWKKQKEVESEQQEKKLTLRDLKNSDLS